MGTNGTYGFYKNGVNKLTYMQFDSYPSGLGKNIVDFIKETSIEEMNDIFDKIILVDENIPATNEQIQECKAYYQNLNYKCSVVDMKKEIRRWNWVLYKARGKLECYKQGLRYMVEANDFIKDSLYCEWGYVINLDTNKLEIYEGFQEENQDNRYKLTQEEINKLREYQYYNCKLIKEFDLNNIPNYWFGEIKDLAVDKERVV